jgi:hypothetical protein
MAFLYRWRVGCGLALGVWLAASAAAAQEPTCRETTQTVMIGGRAERAISVACLQSDGTWRLAPQGAAMSAPQPGYAPPPGYVSQGYASPAPYGYAAPYAPAYYPYPGYAPYYGYGYGYPWYGGIGIGIGFGFGCCGWGHHGFHGGFHGHGGFAHAGFHGGHHR